MTAALSTAEDAIKMDPSQKAPHFNRLILALEYHETTLHELQELRQLFNFEFEDAALLEHPECSDFCSSDQFRKYWELLETSGVTS